MCSIFQSLENYGKIASLFCNYITLQKKKREKNIKYFKILEIINFITSMSYFWINLLQKNQIYTKSMI